MTQYYLLNPVVIGAGQTRFPGELVDDALESAATIAGIRAAGGVLVLATDAAVASAAATINGPGGLRVRGTPLAVLASIMMGALAGELATSAVTGQGWIDLPLTAFRLVDANNLVGNAAANGGLLASDTAPPLGGTSKAQTITWATGSVPPISVQTSVPPDFDKSANASLDLIVSSGTTDAASISVQAIWDQTAAVTYAADDSASKSATAHKVSVAFLSADMPAQPLLLGVMLTPPAHATNAIALWGARLNYKRKVLTS